MTNDDNLDSPIVSLVVAHSKPYILTDTKYGEKGSLLALKSDVEQKQEKYPVLFYFLTEWNRIHGSNYSTKEKDEQSSWDFDCECKGCSESSLHSDHAPLAIEIGKVVIDEKYMETLRGGLSFLEKRVAPQICELRSGDIIVELPLPLPECRSDFCDELLKEIERQIKNSPITKSGRVETSVHGRRVVISQRKPQPYSWKASFRVSYGVELTRRYMRCSFNKQLQAKLNHRQLSSVPSAVKRIHLIDNHMGISLKDARGVVASFSNAGMRYIDYIFLVGGECSAAQLFPEDLSPQP